MRVDEPAAVIGANPVAPQSPEAAGACARIYQRRSTTDSSVEYWQHERGCRAWLVVRRNPSTGEVLDVCLLTAARADDNHGSTVRAAADEAHT